MSDSFIGLLSSKTSSCVLDYNIWLPPRLLATFRTFIILDMQNNLVAYAATSGLTTTSVHYAKIPTIAHESVAST
ncbi:hypothetical protein J1614_005466 [Plenodomus biglobosus]|nr:hypothetical protein J1614_005466 [Plenodomus biglobosus]